MSASIALLVLGLLALVGGLALVQPGLGIAAVGASCIAGGLLRETGGRK